MYLIRPIRKEDFHALKRFADGTQFGMLSLPRDPALLKAKISRSIASFKQRDRLPKDPFYLFVLEETTTRKIGGSCGIVAKTGVQAPLYYFHLKTVATKRHQLPRPAAISMLYPIAERNGPSELCALYLEKNLRKAGLGELLSRSRFLFIAENRKRFSKEITARLRGYIHKKGKTSPFWEGLGKHFLKMEFSKTQALLQKGSSFVSAFLPTSPIYVTLLPTDVQCAIRKAHDSARPALSLLSKEGFELTDQVDIFDGGPTVSCATAEIESVKHCNIAVISEILDKPFRARSYIISNTSLDFRAAYGTLKVTKEGLAFLGAELASALQVKVGDPIRYISKRVIKKHL